MKRQVKLSERPRMKTSQSAPLIRKRKSSFVLGSNFRAISVATKMRHRAMTTKLIRDLQALLCNESDLVFTWMNSGELYFWLSSVRFFI